MTDTVRLMTQAEAEDMAAQLRPHLPKGWTIHVEQLEGSPAAWGIDILDGPDMRHCKEGHSWAVAGVDVEQAIDYLKRRAAERDHRQEYQPVLF